MKIAIIGANGKAGSLLIKEAVERGHEVMAIVRKPHPFAPNVKVLVKDLFALTYDDVKDYPVIIDAFAAWTPETLPLHRTSLAHLTTILSNTTNRLLVVGGAGSLYIDPAHTIRLMDTPDFPEAYLALATNMALALDQLKTRHDVNWSYLSPAANFDPNGPRTGKYRIGQEVLLTNANGESVISYADYASAMLDEVEQNRHNQQRYSVAAI